MQITFGPFYTCFLVTIFLAGFLHIIVHHSSFFQKNTIWILIFGMLVILVRMVIPVNFPFTYSIYSYKLLPILIDFTTKSAAGSSLKIYHIMFIIWIAIALGLLIQLAFRYIRLSNYLSMFYIENNTDTAHLFDLLGKCYEKPMRIAIIPACVSPAVTGLRKPTLILPDISGFSDTELEYIFLHETAHYKNHHLVLILIMEIFCRIHWWNPFVQYVKKNFSLFLELSNDYYLIQSVPEFNTTDYADLIIKIAKRNNSSKDILPTPMMNFVITNQSLLTSRIHFIVNKHPSVHNHFQTILCSGIIFIVITVSVFVVPEARFPDNPSETDGAVEITKDNAYIIESEKGYTLYVYNEEFANLDYIPDDFKDIPLYSEGDNTYEK